MKLGIVGLPNVGKSTLFNSLTGQGAGASNYPYSTVTPNVGAVPVPDKRLDVLCEMYKSVKITPATVEFVDIAGLAKGAARGEGLGNKFLSYIRECDALMHVVRCFEDENVAHVSRELDPANDIETVNIELILADIEVLTRRFERAQKLAKNDKTLKNELLLLERVISELENGKCARNIELTDDETSYFSQFNLLSEKPVLYAANISEDELLSGSGSHSKTVFEHAKSENAACFSVCAKTEEEIAGLSDAEKAEFMNDLGLCESGLDKIIHAGYELLGLISYLTAGPKETRAWTIRNGLKAPQAAGKIHSDIERGFIRAEVVAYDDLVKHGSHAKAKEAGCVRLEGKEYIVKDGDVVLFRFNV